MVTRLHAAMPHSNPPSSTLASFSRAADTRASHRHSPALPSVALCALAVLGCATVTEAKFAYEAGKWDWHKEVFGGLSAVSFRATGRRAVYGGKQGLVGALKKDGGVSWRRSVGLGCDKVVGVTHTTSGSFVLAACDNGAVSAFSSADGDLLWEDSILLQKGEEVVGVTGQTEEEWSSVVTRQGDNLWVRSIVTEDLPYKWGAASSAKLPAGADASGILLSDRSLFVVVDGVSLYTLSLASAEWSKSQLPKDQAWQTYAATKADAVILRSADGTKCLEDGVIREAKELCAPGGASFTYDEVLGKDWRQEKGAVSRVWLWGAAAKAEGEPKWAAVVRFESGDSAAVADGKLSWERDDGLGNVKDVIALNVDEANEDEELRGYVGSYQRLVQQQVEGIVHRFATLPDKFANVAAVLTGRPPSAHKHEASTTENSFGLQRHFLLTSETTLYVVSSVDESFTYRQHVSALLKGHEAPSSEAKIIKVMRSTSSDYAPPHLFVWVRGQQSDYIVTMFETHDASVKVRSLGGFMSEGAVVPQWKYKDANLMECNAAVFVDKAGAVQTHPENAVHSGEEFYYYTVSKSTGAVVGYKLDGKRAVQAFRSQVVSAPGEEVVATSLDSFDIHRYTVADNIKVTGNSSAQGKTQTQIMSKYVNPNAVFIVTSVPARAATDESDKGREAYLIFYLVDGVSGAILNSVVQPNAVGPVNVVALEHMYLVHFFNTKRRRYQLSALELFEDSDKLRAMKGDSTTNPMQIWSAFLGYKEKSYSSFEVATPVMNPTAFTFPVGVRALGVTVSELGVAGKQLIGALSTDEIVAINFDLHMTANALSGVSTIGWLPTMTVSYNKTVHGVNAVKTYSTKLESTSLMVAYGNDIFFSRVNSGKPFDMLKDDFAYIPLVLTASACFALVMVFSHLAARAQKRDVWA